ncbi:organic cation/carnitine transporter 2-like [Ciona intestinalis]
MDNNFAAILEKIGSQGRYQVLMCSLMIYSAVPNGLFAMMPVFTHDTPNHYCEIPELEVLAKTQVRHVAKNPYRALNKFSSLTQKKSTYSDIGFTWNGTSAIPMHTNNSNRVILDCDHGWVYEGDRTTLATEWDGVCSNGWLIPLATSFYMAGVLIGSFLCGILADRFGRRPIFLWGTVIQMMVVLVCSFSVNIYMYITMFFASGFTGILNYMVAFVFVTEITDISKRALVGCLIGCGYTVGYMLLAPVAYFVTDWRWLMRGLSVMGLSFIPYYWLMPESPVWLLCSGRLEEAKILFRKIAEMNGQTLEDEELTTTLLSIKTDNLNNRGEVERFAVSMVYFCISLNTSNLGGDAFINCFVSAAIEIPAYLISYGLLEYVGRRRLLFSLFLFGSIILAVAPFAKYISDTASVVVAMIGKLSFTSVFAVAFIYCCEVFPTLMRNMGIGASSTAARVGAIASPYIVFLGERASSYFAYLIMSFIGLVAAGLCLLLPETKGIPLPETLADAVEMER